MAWLLARTALLSSSGVVPPIVSGILNPITNRTALRSFNYSNSSANRHDVRIRHKIAGQLTAAGVVFTYVGWLFQATALGDLAQTPTTKILDEVFVEYPTGVMTQVKFGGATSVTINPWDVIRSDPVPIKPAKGELVFEQLSYRQTGSNVFDQPLTILAALGEYSSLRASSSNGSAASYAAGTAGALPPGITGGQGWGAANIEGYTSTPGFIIVGDSIADGAGGDQGATSVENPGYVARTLANNFGFIRVTCPSSSLSSGANALNSLNLTRGQVKYAIIEEGINDVLGGATLATIQQRYTWLARNLRQAGVKKVFVTTLLPSTLSTPGTNNGDNFATLANQTVKASESVRVSVNSWLLSNPAIFDGVIDVTPALDQSDTTKWPADGNPFTNTSDGTHPTTLMNDRIATYTTPQLAALVAAAETADPTLGGLGTLTNARPAKPTKKTAQVSFGVAANTFPYHYWDPYQSAGTLALTDWSTATETAAHVVSGSPSGWSISVSGTIDSNRTDGATSGGNQIASIPDTVITTYTQVSATNVVYTISGLNPAKTYDLDVLCSSLGTTQNTNITVAGLAATTTRVIAAQNNFSPSHYSAIAPDASGNITLTVVRATGASRGMINALQIAEN